VAVCDLLTGPLEPTNQWYAVSKIAGIKLVEAFRQQYGADFISVMPTNLYGPGDNYHDTAPTDVYPAMLWYFRAPDPRRRGRTEDNVSCDDASP
jgi:GDP-L-fucose synthase